MEQAAAQGVVESPSLELFKRWIDCGLVVDLAVIG